MYICIYIEYIYIYIYINIYIVYICVYIYILIYTSPSVSDASTRLLTHWGTSLMRKRNSLGPYSRHMGRALWRSSR